MPPGLQDRFLGVIVGTAVGDALGAPYEGHSRRRLLKLGGIGDGYRPIRGYPLGQYTDDTQLTLAIARSIIDCRGVNGEDIARRFVQLWRSGEIVGAGASCSQAVRNIMRGTHWQQAGTEPGRAGNGTAMRVSPVGLWHYNRPLDILKRDAIISSIITHHDPRSTAGAVAVAGGVAYAVSHQRIDTGELVDQLADLVADVSPEFAEYINRLPHWLGLPEDQARWEIAAAGWRKPEDRLDYITPFVIPTVLICLYYFLKFPADFLGNIRRVILAGGDVDTTAAISGALSGAYTGIGAIPRTLVDGVLNSRHLRQVGIELWQAKQADDKERTC
jgi:ADP-ribosylglycohydrolase